jgi:hypothetical protein
MKKKEARPASPPVAFVEAAPMLRFPLLLALKSSF